MLVQEAYESTAESVINGRSGEKNRQSRSEDEPGVQLVHQRRSLFEVDSQALSLDNWSTGRFLSSKDECLGPVIHVTSNSPYKKSTSPILHIILGM